MRTFAGTLYLCALMAVAWMMATSASAQVTVVLQQPPPNQLRVADLWRITIVNPTSNTYQVFLRGTAAHDRDGQVVDARSGSFTVFPNQTKFVTGVDISPIKVDSSNKRYQDILTRTGTAPAGKYTICVYVNATAVNGTPLNPTEVIGQDCISGHEVQPQTPPILVRPDDKSEVSDKLPVFAWLPPTPLKSGQQVRYELRIVEVLGRQTPYDAITSNPAWFKTSIPVFTQYQYPIAARSFVNGRKYAWQIKALDNRYLIGESEIWWFKYNPVSVGSTDASGSPLLPGGPVIPTNGSGGNDPGDDLRERGFNEQGIPYDREALIYLEKYADPNAVKWRKNVPNETLREGALCGARPSIAILDSVESVGSFTDWPGSIRLRWIVRTATPIDHIDLRVRRVGSDSTLKHFIYRPRDGELPMGTVISPRSLAGRPEDLGTIVVRAVAVDVLGRTSLPTSHEVALSAGGRSGGVGSEPYTIDRGGASGDVVNPYRDTIIIGSDRREGRTYTTYSTTELSIARASRTVTMINNDVVPHHFRSVYTPLYIEFDPPLGIGGVPRIDFGRLGPGESRTITLPEELRTCYTWTLYDMESPTPTNRLKIVVNAVVSADGASGGTGMPGN